MAAGTLDQDSSLETILEHIIYSMALLMAHPQTGQLAPSFEQQVEQWWTIDRAEKLHWIEILKAAARIVAADNRLDAVVDRLSNTLLLATEGAKKADEYRYYFGAKKPAELKRPVLGGQLETMSKWVPTLKASSHPALAALGVELEAAVEYASAQVKALATVKEENRRFRKLGERKSFIDAANALRKSTFGTLAEMPHKQPDLLLPNGFAELFFKPVRRRQAADSGGSMTAAEMRAWVARREAELEVERARLAEMEADEAADAKDRAQRTADEELLAEAEREAEEAAERILALRAKLGR